MFVCEVVSKVKRGLVLTGLGIVLAREFNIRLGTRIELEVRGLQNVFDHTGFRFARLSRH